MSTENINTLGMEGEANSSAASALEELSPSQTRTQSDLKATPLSPSLKNMQHKKSQLDDQTLESPLTHTIADTISHLPSAPLKDGLEVSTASALKRPTRKHNSVSFRSPLARQLATPNKSSFPPSNTTRLHHRPRTSASPASSTSFGTTAQQLALIQQRYVAEQDIAQQQRRLQKQLVTPPVPVPTSPHGWLVRPEDTMNAPLMGELGTISMIGGDDDVEDDIGTEQQGVHHSRKDTEAESDVTRRVVQLQNPASPLQEQTLNSPHVPVVPDAPNPSKLHPADVKQTNDALAQQLAMLTLINQFKTADSHRNQGSVGLTQPRATSGGHVDITGITAEAMPRNISGMVTGRVSPGAMFGTRTDPLYNPGGTSNVYINNLPTTFTEAHLYQLCAAFGTILSVRMMLRETGTSYGFVLFETVEAAESCIMWLRQFSDVHPSFARTPLKTVAHKLLDHQQPLNLRGVALPETRLASPIRFARADAGDGFNGATRTLSSDQAHYHVPANDYPGLIPSHSTPLEVKNLNRDIRPSTGRLGAIGLQQLFPQRDPASVNAIVSAAARIPSTPLHRGAVVPTTIETGNARGNTSSHVPSLFIDGLPSTVDLPSLEYLFDPHRVLSARFFRTAQTSDINIADPIRVVALVRLDSVVAVEESIDKYDRKFIPGWTPSGTKLTVSLADSDHQSRLTLSEQRIQSILSRHADILDSPLNHKSHSLYRKTQTAPSSFVSTLSGSILSKPLTRNSSHESLPSVPQLSSSDDAQIRTVLKTNSANNKPLDAASFMDDGDDDMKVRAVTGSSSYPGMLYRVPDNTPAKTASSQTGRSSNRYVVQLPANYLERRPGLMTHDSEEEDIKTSGSRMIVDEKFPVPAPSLFKAARKSAPVRIRAPTEESPRGLIGLPRVSGAEFRTPELGQTTNNGDDEHSPTTTFGTATPATSAGPYTPSIPSIHCSPASADQKADAQHSVHRDVDLISSESL